MLFASKVTWASGSAKVYTLANMKSHVLEVNLSEA
jgi:hypothetical protein